MTMKSCFSGPFLLLLLLCGAVCVLGSVVVKKYSRIYSHYNWHEAQLFCRSLANDTDLATFFKTSDEDQIDLTGYHAWIGLYRLSPLSWMWQWTNGVTKDHKHWAENEPYFREDCAVIYSNRRIYSKSCERHSFFICEASGGGNDKFKFLPESKTWTEALEYCQSHFSNLAYLPGNNNMNSAVKEQDFPIWTGLHREGGTWKWSSGLSEYRNWASHEPSDRGDCVSISSRDKKMSTQNCLDRFPVICLKNNLVLVKENKTWEEALEHCRALRSSTQYGLRYDLVSVQPGTEHEYVTTKVKEADTEEVWAGLRFLAGDWLWVNKAAVLFPDLPLCPPMLQRCGALTKNDTDGLLLADCSEKRNFLCYSTY